MRLTLAPVSSEKHLAIDLDHWRATGRSAGQDGGPGAVSAPVAVAL